MKELTDDEIQKGMDRVWSNPKNVTDVYYEMLIFVFWTLCIILVFLIIDIVAKLI
jgi:hypothetical protein